MHYPSEPNCPANIFSAFLFSPAHINNSVLEPLTYIKFTETALLPKGFRSSLVKHFTDTFDPAGSGSFGTIVKAIMPDAEISAEISQQSDQGSMLELLKLAIFLISNKMCNFYDSATQETYQWLRKQTNIRALENILSTKGPTTEALAENLFPLAINAEDVSVVKMLLKMGLDPNQQLCNQMTPLQRVCELCNLELARSLIEAGADVNKTYETFTGSGSALQLAIYGGRQTDEFVKIELVRILVSAGAEVNPKNEPNDFSEFPLLFLAAQLGHVELVNFLISAGANVNSRAGGSSALIGSITSKNPDENVMVIVRSLLDAGADANATGYFSCSGFSIDRKFITVLGGAVERGKVELVQLLLHAGARVCESSLGSAVEKGNIELLRLLLRNRAHSSGFALESRFVLASGFGFTLRSGFALEKAVGTGDFNIVEILVQAGSRITNAALEKAAGGANIKLLEFLLDTLQSVELNKKYRSIALTEAISCGKLDKINALMDSGAQLIGDNKLARAIEHATRRGDIHVIRLLLDDGSRYRATAVEWLGGSLQAAISAGEDAITAELLAACADVKPVVLAAIHRKDADLVQKLLRAGASVNLESPCDISWHPTHSVLPAAVDWGNCSVIRDIIDAGVDIDSVPYHQRLTESDSKTITTALTTAVIKKDIPIVQLLIDAGADVNNLASKVHGFTALEAAVRNNDTNMVYYLINLGADLNDEGALLQAAILGNVELIQLLLGARSRPYARFRKDYGCPTLQIAMKLKKREILETLLKNKIAVNMIVRQQIPVDKRFLSDRAAALGMSREEYDREFMKYCWLRFGESALGTSIKEDKSTDLWMVRMILRAGANLNNVVTEDPKHNALLAAIEMNNAPLVQLLLDAGAEANSAATAGIRHTPLQLAAEKGNMEIVQMLLKLDADVNAPPADRYGATALQFAAIGGYIGLACLLLKEGAEVNAAPAKVGGRTALEGAAEHGRIDMLQLLLNAGAGIAGPSSYHYVRAMNFASEKGRGAARRLLESYSALWSENVFEPAEIDGKYCGSSEDLQF